MAERKDSVTERVVAVADSAVVENYIQVDTASAGIADADSSAGGEL